MEFGTFSKAAYPEPERFFDDLDGFLCQLPKDLRYSVEIRNDNFLDARYFGILRSNRVAHIFNSWSRMPSLRQQILTDEAFTAPFTVVRALLRPADLIYEVDMSGLTRRSGRNTRPRGKR